ncbi:DedA family protein [Brevibacillus sp. B_LB10_24]|uniref:DedA family protein n=1 Tax=Brevibacillus sp. B_LB10_24 TaxID=3380645 RepID=UPI0038B738A1
MQEVLLHSVQLYGYLAVFLLLALGIVGLPVPDELVMMFTGYLAAQGKMSFWVVLIVSVAGSMCGMLLSFLLGRFFGIPLLRKLGPRLRLKPARIEKSGRWFERYGLFVVCFGYFLPGVRNLSAYFAGVRRWSVFKFSGAALPGAAIWAFLYVRLGFYLGDSWRSCFASTRGYLLLAAGILLAVILIWSGKKVLGNRQNGKTRGK